VWHIDAACAPPTRTHCRITLGHIHKDLQSLSKLVGTAEAHAENNDGQKIGCCLAFLQVCDIHVSICVACIHPMHAFDTCACAHAQGGKARRWEAELERTEKKLRTNLEMLVRTETLQGYTRDRARENDRLTRFSRAEHGCQAFERKTCNLT